MHSLVRGSVLALSVVIGLGCAGTNALDHERNSSGGPGATFLWATKVDLLRERIIDLGALRHFLRERSSETRWALEEHGWILASGPVAEEDAARTAVHDLYSILRDTGGTESPKLVATVRNVRTGESFTRVAEPSGIINDMGYDMSWDGLAAFLVEYGDRELEVWLGDRAFEWRKANSPVMVDPVTDDSDKGALLAQFEPEVEPGAPRELRDGVEWTERLFVELWRAGIPVFQGCFEVSIEFPIFVEGGFDAIDAEQGLEVEWDEGLPPTNREVFGRELNASSRVMEWANSER